MDAELATKYDALKAYVSRFDTALIAFSGGIDSSLVAYVTAEQLSSKALAVTSGSASLKRSDLSLAKHLAVEWGMEHRVIVTDELSKPDYRANPINRCFHCKTSLYQSLAEIADAEGFDVIFNGTNTDDLGDHRPGLIAADDFHVRSPLVEVGFARRHDGGDLGDGRHRAVEENVGGPERLPEHEEGIDVLVARPALSEKMGRPDVGGGQGDGDIRVDGEDLAPTVLLRAWSARRLWIR